MRTKQGLILAVFVIALVLVPAFVLATTTVGNDVSVGGILSMVGGANASSTLQVTGALTTYGNVTLGDAASDVVTLNGYFANTLTVGNGTTATSTLGSNYLKVGMSASEVLGKFYVDSSGNVSASGTLGVFSATTLTGALIANGAVTLGDAASDLVTLNGYFNALTTGNGTATSTLSGTAFSVGKVATASLGKFYVDSSGNVSASGTIRAPGTAGSTSTIWVGGLEGIKGQICFGDTDGSGATCITGNDGQPISFATTTY